MTLAGLWLSFYREYRNVKQGKRDIQTLVYDKAKGVFNFSFAIGLVLVGGGLFASIYTVKNHTGCAPSIVREQEMGRLMFRFKYNPSPELVRFMQQTPLLSSRNIVRQGDEYFDEYINLPMVDSNYFAYFTPGIKSSEYKETNAIVQPWQVCFKRVCASIREDKVIAILTADSTGMVSQDVGDPKCVVLCNPEQANVHISMGIFPGAHAQTVQHEKKMPGWAVPNLQTLRDRKTSGYSLIRIHSRQLNPLLKEATLYHFSVRVNGVPIYFDGLRPELIKYPFSYAKGLSIEFGMENLGFSGADKGHEKIEVTIQFFRNSNFISAESVSFDYVALRSSATQTLETGNRSVFEWEASFTANKESQVFVLSTTDVDEALRTKRKVDSRALIYKGDKVVAVIRPPYKDNPHYGVCIGMELPSRQIKFTFTASDAMDLKKYLSSLNFKPAIRPLADN